MLDKHICIAELEYSPVGLIDCKPHLYVLVITKPECFKILNNAQWCQIFDFLPLLPKFCMICQPNPFLEKLKVFTLPR